MSLFDSVVFYTFLILATFLITALLTSRSLKKRKKVAELFSFLGLTTSDFSFKRTFLDSFLLLFVVIALLTIEAIVLSTLNLDDSQKVAVAISKLSLPGIIIASTLGPLAEELFFRGFLQKFTGVIISSLLFALLHFSFGSVTEIIGAFTAGAVFGYWVKYKSNFLLPVIMAHAGYNVISILFTLVLQ